MFQVFDTSKSQRRQGSTGVVEIVDKCERFVSLLSQTRNSLQLNCLTIIRKYTNDDIGRRYRRYFLRKLTQKRKFLES